MPTENCPHCGELVHWPATSSIPVICVRCGGAVEVAGIRSGGGQAPALRTLSMVLGTSPLITVGAAGYADPPGMGLPEDAAWYAKQAYGIRGAGDTPAAAVHDLIARGRKWLDEVESALGQES